MFGFIELAVLVIMLALSRATCPPGWSNNGIRPTGAYECLGPLSPPGCGEPDDISPPCIKPAIKTGRIYCTSGTRPIVVDARTVGCQAWRH